MLDIVIDDQPFRDVVAEISRRTRDLTPALAVIGMKLEERVSSRFETRTDPDGNPWAAWSQSTIDTYPEGGNRRLLDRLGDMLEGLSHQVNSGDSSVSIGFDRDYSTYHEWGTETMPRRGLLTSDPDAGTLSEDDTELVLEVLNDFLNDLA